MTMIDFGQHGRNYIVNNPVADACGACNQGRNLREIFIHRNK